LAISTSVGRNFSVDADAFGDGGDGNVQPSKQQLELYGDLLMDDEPANGWWLGWCPHDKSRADDEATAEYNFQLGRFKCIEMPSCHEGKRSLTLSAALAWIQGYKSVADMKATKKASRQAAAKKATAERQAERTAKQEAQAERRAERQAERAEARAERRAKHQDKFAGAAERLAKLTLLHPNIDPQIMPSKAQILSWEPWLKIDKAPVIQNSTDGWWAGWCPLHDKDHHKGRASAMFNFRYGSYRCLRAEPCHAPKKGMTLVNLARAMNA
jgi:hypothetical protein